MTEITTEGSSFQNNTANIGNTRGGYFSYFSTIGANPFGRGFGGGLGKVLTYYQRKMLGD